MEIRLLGKPLNSFNGFKCIISKSAELLIMFDDERESMHGCHHVEQTSSATLGTLVFWFYSEQWQMLESENISDHFRNSRIILCSLLSRRHNVAAILKICNFKFNIVLIALV